MVCRVVWGSGRVLVKPAEGARQVILWQGGNEVCIPVEQISRLVDALNHEKLMVSRALPGELADVPVVLVPRERSRSQFSGQK